jgi:hypothetical protein
LANPDGASVMFLLDSFDQLGEDQLRFLFAKQSGGERMSEGVVVVRSMRGSAIHSMIASLETRLGRPRFLTAQRALVRNDSQAALLLQKKHETHIEDLVLSTASDRSAPVSHTHIDGVFLFLVEACRVSFET